MSHNKLTLSEVLLRFEKIHPKGQFLYTSFTEYKSRKSTISIYCTKCKKEFPRTVDDHLSGRGCPYNCKTLKLKAANQNRLLSIEVVKERTENNLKTKTKNIDWSKAIYINSKTKIQLYCLDHDEPLEFWKEPSELMLGKTCPVCGMLRSNKGGAYSKEYFKRISDSNNGKASFYIIKGYNFQEEFFKFGITTKSLNERFGRQGKFPYVKDVLLLVEGDSDLIWDIENVFKATVKISKYIPKIKFGGSEKECFKILPDMVKILNHELFIETTTIVNIFNKRNVIV